MATGEQLFTTPGTYLWTAPNNVTSVCVVAVGGGGGGGGSNYDSTSGGGGGGLGWKNNILVTPGQAYTVVVGEAGSITLAGGNSYFINTSTVVGFGGQPGIASPGGTVTGGLGGTYVGDGGGNGGNGGGTVRFGNRPGAGGGAGGYTGNGGIGSGSNQYYLGIGAGGPGLGGGGGGGASASSSPGAGSGGGVGLYGEGPSGASSSPGQGGWGGSGGDYGTVRIATEGFRGGNYGGGGAGATNAVSSPGGKGAVRIIWGAALSFPNNAVVILAGKGALVDGSVVDSTSNEASMLFHSCTFITPDVDAITMTNGVRVEWLNSFTYFANKGLYATQGTGRITQDGITLRYGAELRAIGSASVYGNYGAYADGANVLMYLVNHNFAYIGSGTDSNNDLTLVNQENEVVTLNGADIHFTSMDQSGDFRAGDIFVVESATGIIRFNSLAFTANSLYLTNGTDITDITASEVQTGNILIRGNTISSTVNNIILDAANNQIDVTSNVTAAGNVITENIVTDATTTIGNTSLDTLNFNSNFSQNLFTTANKDLGSTFSLWNNLYTSKLSVNDIVIDGNTIKTVVSNSNLELGANGTGAVQINSIDITSNLISSNITDTNININPNGIGTVQLLKNTYVTGNLDVTGNIRGAGNIQLGDVILDNINTIGKIGSNIIPNSTHTYDIGSTLKRWRTLFTSEVVTDDIVINTNFITTTQSNSNLELRANGTGAIRIDQIDISSNNITINNINSNLNLQSNGTGTLNFLSNTRANTDLTVTTDLLVDANTQFGNTSTDSVTFVAEIISNITPKTANQHNLGTTTKGFNDVFVDTLNSIDIEIVGNVIETTQSNSNLELTANGTGAVRIDQIDINNNTISINTLNSNFDIQPNGTGTVQLQSNSAITGNLIVTTDLLVDTNTQFGNTSGDSVTFISEITSDINPKTANQHNLGTITKGFNDVFVDTLRSNDIKIVGNVIETSLSNSNLELIANGTGAIRIDQIDINGNTVSVNTLNSNLDIQPNGTGTVQLQSNSAVTGNLIVTANAVVDATTQFGNTSSDSVTFISELISNIVPSANQQYALGSNTKQFNNVFVDTLQVNDITITGNVISTSVSNSDLEFSATKDVAILTDNFEITNNLTVLGTANLSSTAINGLIIQTGNTIRTGNVNLTGNLTSSTISSTDLVQLNEIQLQTNFVTTTSIDTDLNLQANGTGVVRFFDNTTINNDLTIVGNTTVTNLTIFSSIESPVLTTTNINILGNLITTTVANTDLELGANGTGVVSIPYDSLSLGVDLTVNGTSNFKTSTVVGDIDIIGNYNQLLPSSTFNTNVVIGSSNLTSTSDSQFERIRISGNRIRTTTLNNNLILTANGTGIVDIIDAANFANNLTVLGASNVAGSIVVSNILTAGGYDFGNIEISGNVIKTTESNSNLELRGNAAGGIKLEEITLVNSTFTSTSSIGVTPTGTGSVKFNATNALVIPKGNTSNRTLSEAGEVRFNTTHNSFEGYGNAGLIILDNLQDGDRNTSITPELTVGSGDNVIRFYTNGTQRTSINSTGITAHGLRTSTLEFNTNTISSYNSNADVELRPNGTGKVVLPTFTIKNGLITNTTINANIVLDSTGQGYTALGDTGLVVPVGDNTNRPAIPEVGHTRYNTDEGYLEVWTGTVWVVATGGGSYISEAEVNDITDFYALIFG